MMLTRELESQLKMYSEKGAEGGVLFVLRNEESSDFSVSRVEHVGNDYILTGKLASSGDAQCYTVKFLVDNGYCKCTDKKYTYDDFIEFMEQHIDLLQIADTKYEFRLVANNKVNMADSKSLMLIKEGYPVGMSINLNCLFKQLDKANDLLWEMSRYVSYLISELESKINTQKLDALRCAVNNNYDATVIFSEIINYDKNKELLQAVPHRRIEDLALIYRHQILNNDSGMFSSIITNDTLEHLFCGITEKDLFKAVTSNTNAHNQYSCTTLEEALREKFPECIDDFPKGVDSNLYILTNELSTFGASCLARNDVLYSVACRLNSDLLILPSSIHECLVLEYDAEMVDYLRDCVACVNKDAVSAEDFLSNSVYKFTYDSKELSLI